MTVGAALDGTRAREGRLRSELLRASIRPRACVRLPDTLAPSQAADLLPVLVPGAEGFRLGRPCGPRCLRPLRLPFRHSGWATRG